MQISAGAKYQQFKDEDRLRPDSWGSYSRAMFPLLAAFDTAGLAIKTGIKHKIIQPHINDKWPGTFFRKYPVDEFGDLIPEGRRSLESDDKEYKKEVREHKKCEAELLITIQPTITPESLILIQSHPNYLAAMIHNDSFDMWDTMEKSHTGTANVNMIVFRVEEFMKYQCTETRLFPEYSMNHQRLVKEFALALQSKTHPGYISIDTFSCAMLLSNLKAKFWDTKKEKVLDNVASIHDLKYGALIADLSAYFNRHQLTQPQASSTTSTDLAILTTIPPTSSSISNSVPLGTKYSDMETCLRCKKMFVRVEMRHRPGFFFKNCKECGIIIKKERDLKGPSDASVTKAKEVLSKLPGGTAHKDTTHGSILTTVPPPTAEPTLTAADVARMISDATFGAGGRGNYVVTLAINSSVLSDSSFFFDSCGSLSGTFHQKLLQEYRPCEPINLGSYNGQTLEAIGWGYLPHFPIPNFRVHYVPGSKANIISIGQWTYVAKGKTIQEDDWLEVYSPITKKLLVKTYINTNTLHHTVPHSWIYGESSSQSVILPPIPPLILASTQSFPKFWTREELIRMALAKELHFFLLHRNYDTIKRGLAIRAYGPECILLPVDIDNLIAREGPCPICIEAKMKHNSIPIVSPTSVPTTKPGCKVHMDIQLLPCPSVGGNTQAVTYLDDASRFAFTNGSKSKEDLDLLQSAKGFVNEANSRGWKVSLIVTDPERCNRSLKGVIGLALGITIQFVPVDDHEHSVEAHIQIIDNTVTCIRASTPFHIPPKYILNLKAAAATMSNLSPINVFNFATTPYESWKKEKFIPHPTYPYLQVGNTVMSKCGKGHRSTEALHTGYPINQTMKSEEGVILGIDTDTVPASYHILIASGIVDSRTNIEPVNITPFNWTPKKVLQSSIRQHPQIFDTEDYNSISSTNIPPQGLSSVDSVVPQPITLNQRPIRSTAGINKQLEGFIYSQEIRLTLNKDVKTDHSLKAAQKIPRIQPYLPDAIDKELSKINTYKTGKIITPYEVPMNAFQQEFLFRVKEKYKSDGEFDKVNGRMVFNGLVQPASTFFDIIALTASLPLFFLGFCLIQADAISRKRIAELTFICVDVPAAFLQGDLDTANCPRPLIGRIPGSVPNDMANSLFLLFKAYYGTKNANGIFDKKFDSLLRDIYGMTTSPMDPRKYILRDDPKSSSFDPFHVVLVNLHVDDSGIISTAPTLVATILNAMTKVFGPLVMNDPISSYLSLLITRHPNGAYTFSMDNNIMGILKATNMLDDNIPIMNQPARINAFRIDDSSSLFEHPSIYATIIGKLIHTLKIRFDIRLPVANSSRFTKAPTVHNSTQVVEILQYLKGTPDLGPTYYTEAGPTIISECDAAHAVYETGNDHFGVRHMVGDRNNAPFAVSSKKQDTCVTPAPAGGEFGALSMSCMEIIVYRNFADDIGFRQKYATELYTDCDPAITMANSPNLTKNSKFYCAKVGFVRECVDRGIVQLIHTPGAGNPTDLLAKPTTGADFKNKRNALLNVKSNPNFNKYL